MKQWSIAEIEKAVNGRLINSPGGVITGVATDSRADLTGKLFVPIKGERFDGHNFIESAFSNGAVCALSEGGRCENSERPIIIVDDTRKALLDMTAAYRSMFNVKIIAVTGSVGKTTTKDMIASVLSAKYKVLKTEGNLNNDIGLPLTVFNMDGTHEVAVLEMGMNALGEIAVLSKAVKPDIAVITNIGTAHLEKLGSRKNILAAKLEIFQGMESGGRAFLNGDDDMLKTVAGNPNGLSVTFFGIDENNDVCASDIVTRGLDGVDCRVYNNSDDFSAELFIPLSGGHMVYNALAAAAVGEALGLSAEEIRSGVAGFKPSKQRLSIKTIGGITVIDDTYNANPDSMRAALNVLLSAKGRKVCILGDMLELGGGSGEMHYSVGKYAAELGIDCIVCVGKQSRNTYDGAVFENNLRGGRCDIRYFGSKSEVIDSLASLLNTGSSVLIKASRGMAFEEIVEKAELEVPGHCPNPSKS